jgi:uncharacterized protein YegP (UPF0339 family)
MYYLVYREPDSHLYRWTLYDENGRKMAQSVEKHYNRRDCLAAIERVKQSGSVPVREAAAEEAAA